MELMWLSRSKPGDDKCGNTWGFGQLILARHRLHDAAAGADREIVRCASCTNTPASGGTPKKFRVLARTSRHNSCPNDDRDAWRFELGVPMNWCLVNWCLVGAQPALDECDPAPGR